jgi:hypothetical protein
MGHANDFAIISGRNNEDVRPVPPRRPDPPSPELKHISRVVVALGVQVVPYDIFVPKGSGEDLSRSVEVRVSCQSDRHFKERTISNERAVE